MTDKICHLLTTRVVRGADCRRFYVKFRTVLRKIISFDSSAYGFLSDVGTTLAGSLSPAPAVARILVFSSLISGVINV